MYNISYYVNSDDMIEAADVLLMEHEHIDPRFAKLVKLPYPELGDVEAFRSIQTTPYRCYSAAEQDLLITLDAKVRDRVRHATYLRDSDIGEVIIQFLRYPAAEESVGLVAHTDYCYLTVPLFDSAAVEPLSPGKLFYSEMARPFGHRPHTHKFHFSTFERVYVVGFVQLRFDLVLPDGRKYYQHLEDVMERETGVRPNYNPDIRYAGL